MELPSINVQAKAQADIATSPDFGEGRPRGKPSKEEKATRLAKKALQDIAPPAYPSGEGRPHSLPVQASVNPPPYRTCSSAPPTASKSKTFDRVKSRVVAVFLSKVVGLNQGQIRHIYGILNTLFADCTRLKPESDRLIFEVDTQKLNHWGHLYKEKMNAFTRQAIFSLFVVHIKQVEGKTHYSLVLNYRQNKLDHLNKVLSEKDPIIAAELQEQAFERELEAVRQNQIKLAEMRTSLVATQEALEQKQEKLREKDERQVSGVGERRDAFGSLVVEQKESSQVGKMGMPVRPSRASKKPSFTPMASFAEAPEVDE